MKQNYVLILFYKRTKIAIKLVEVMDFEEHNVNEIHFLFLKMSKEFSYSSKQKSKRGLIN